METRKITALVNSVSSFRPYDEDLKTEFALAARIFLCGLAKELGIDADIRYNTAGAACSGTAVLHGDSLYVHINADSGLGILVRCCKGPNDYIGGPNAFVPFSTLARECQSGFPTFREEMGRYSILT